MADVGGDICAGMRQAAARQAGLARARLSFMRATGLVDDTRAALARVRARP